MAYLVELVNEVSEVIDGADAYQQEGPLTTFFRTAPGRAVVDCWSTRLASFRTVDVRVIRMCDGSSGYQFVPSGSPSR
jgi:hypothetical protein